MGESFMKQFVVGSAIMALVLGLVGTASAVPCGTTPGLDTNEVSFRGVDSDNCAGVFPDNVNKSDLPIIIPGLGSEPFTAIVSSDGGPEIIEGITFSLTADEGSTSGDWLLSFSATPSITEVFDLGVIVKAGPNYAVYLFEDESFTTNGTGAGTFRVSFTNPGGQIPDLSHLSVLFRAGEPATGTAQEPTTGQQQEPVPGPAPLAAMGIGLVVMALGAGLRRRR
jgi:hypothetical protein